MKRVPFTPNDNDTALTQAYIKALCYLGDEWYTPEAVTKRVRASVRGTPAMTQRILDEIVNDCTGRVRRTLSCDGSQVRYCVRTPSELEELYLCDLIAR